MTVQITDLPIPPLPEEPHLRPGSIDLRRRLLLWVGLPALLCAGWALAGGGQQVSGSMALLVLAGFAALATALFWLSARQQLDFTQANAAASTRVYEGKLAQACAAFEANARRYRSPALHALSVFNLADTELQRGNLRRALSLAAGVATHRSLLRSPMVASSAPSLVAACYALLGELENAKAWMPVAQRAAATTAIEVSRVPEAIIACREGRFADVSRMYRERRRAIEAALAGEDLRALRLMRAYAMASDPGATEKERAEAIAMGRPGAPGECDYLAAAWPELGEFLKKNGM
ncbi:MAG TPA: hypothetical protein VGK67_00905 [Myxococcales bacterium]|jgi:hypothetical protein